MDRIEKLRQSKEKDKLLPNLKDRMNEVLGSLKKLKLCEKNAFGFIKVKNKTKIGENSTRKPVFDRMNLHKHLENVNI